MELEGRIEYIDGPPIGIDRVDVDQCSTGPGGTVYIRDEDNRAKILASYTYTEENAELIATSFKVAKMARDRGYDPLEAVKALPALLDFVETFHSFEFGVDDPESFQGTIETSIDLLNEISQS